MITLAMAAFLGGWILLRRFWSILEVPERKVIAKYRLYGLGLGATISLLLEMMVGRYLFRMDPVLEMIVGPVTGVVVFSYFEWLGEGELRKRGVKTAGVFSSKLY